MDLFGGGKQEKPSKKVQGEPSPEEKAKLRKQQADAATDTQQAAQVIEQHEQMKDGDYQVHIHVLKGKSFKLETEDSIDPYIKFNLLNNSKQTIVKSGVKPDSRVTWDEHIFMDFFNLTSEDIGNAQLQILAENKGFFKGDMIGTFSLSINKIYSMENHAMRYQTIGLNNPESEDFTDISGYVTISVQVIGPGDEAIELNMVDDKQIALKKPMMPTQVKLTYKQIFIRFFVAENLPIMDHNLIDPDSIDAYLKVLYNGTAVRTKVYTMKDRKVKWNQEVLIPVELPLRDETIKIQLWDSDTVVDEFVCSLDIPIKSILNYERKNYRETGNSRMKWINFYGPPQGASGEEANKMRRDPTKASTWAGRVLVEWFCMDSKYPAFKIRNIRQRAIIQRAEDYSAAKKQYLFLVEAGQGITLPGSEKYKIRFQLGTFALQTEAKVVKRNYARWDARKPKVFEESYQHLKEFPTLYVYLVDENDNKICFYRESLLRFTKYQVYQDSALSAEQGPYQWLQFEPDLSVGKVQSAMQAGIFSMRLYVHDLSEGPFNPDEQPAWQKQPPRSLNPYRMRAAIYQCESLPPADTEGHSDPYVEIWSADEKDSKRITTVVCQDTNNPIYYEVKEFHMDFKESSLDSAMPIVLNVYDKDESLFDKTDDLIGRAIIHLSVLDQKGLLSRTDEIPAPQWFPIKKTLDEEFDKITGASILCSFQMIPFQDMYKVEDASQIELDDATIEISPGIPYPMPNLDIREFKVQIIVLGLRDLVSTGLFEVNKAYVTFNLKSLLSAARARAVNNVQTQPNDKGKDPNIRTTIQFEVEMPSQEQFCPKMTCDVYDLVFFNGSGQPHIGTFALQLGKAAHEGTQRAQTVIQMMGNITQKLNNLNNQIALKKNLGEEFDVLEIVNSQNARPKNSRKPNRKQKDQQKLAEGARALDLLSRAGIQLPGSQDKLLKGKKGRVIKEKKNEDQEDPENIDNEALFEADDVDGEVKEAAPADNESIDLDEGELALLNADQLKAKLGSALRKQVEAAFLKNLEDQKEKLDRAREQEQNQINRERKDAQQNIVKPRYEPNERLNVDMEVDPPPKSLFLEIGHDPKPGAGKKHYRRFYPDELEQVLDKDGHPLVNSPFLNAPIYRAKPKKKQNLLSSLFQSTDESDLIVHQTGVFKGIVRAFEEDVRNELEQEVIQSLSDLLNTSAEVMENPKAQENARELLQEILKHSRGGKKEQKNIEGHLDKLRKHLNQAGIGRFGIHPLVSEIVFQYQIMSKLNQIEECKVRLYALDGFNFAKRDLFSLSDPYLIVKCGKKTYNDRDNYKLDTNTPEFYKHFDFFIDLPGAPMLEIEAYDHDGFFGDELIGSTKIDLDDRYYSLTWQSMDDSPIEFRDLYHPSSTVTQGVLKLWVEINEKDSKNANRKPFDVQPRPLEHFEVRCVVWKTEGIPTMDIEGTSDIQIMAGFDQNKMHKTDTHWRCANGEGSFNYRMKIPLSNKAPTCDFRIEAIDRDIIKNNDVIGGCTLDLTAMRKDVMDSKKKVVLHRKYFEEYLAQNMDSPDKNQINFDEDDKQKFWVPVKKPNLETGLDEDNGRILITLHMVPERDSNDDPQGVGREEPNNDPYCPPPEGRIKLTINPIDFISQMIPASAWRKIAAYACCAFLCFLFIIMAPMIVSDLIARGISG